MRQTRLHNAQHFMSAFCVLNSARAFAPIHPPPSHRIPTVLCQQQDGAITGTPDNASSQSSSPSFSLEQSGMVLRDNASSTSRGASIKSWIARFRKRVSKAWKRPGVRFRIQLGVVTTAILFIASLALPQKKPLGLVTKWMTQRGFQGLSALGRSVAYAWALLVAYPRLLDKRAQDKRQNEDALQNESKRRFLKSLAKEVVRLRTEVTGLDSEIRSFRREVLSLRAQGYVDPEVQEAIHGEMQHLMQLRADRQAALQAVRQAWSDTRAKSPQVWDDEDVFVLDSVVNLKGES